MLLGRDGAHGGRAAQPVQVLADLRGGLDVVVDFGHVEAVGAQRGQRLVQRGAHRRGAAWPQRRGDSRPMRGRARRASAPPSSPRLEVSPAARRRAWPDRLPAARPCRRRWGRCARCSRRRWAGATGDAPVRGLQADGAGEGGRDADRAARVAAHGQAHHAGGHGRRAAAAAAGRERRVPRIAGDAEGRTVGDAFPVEFRGAGLAQQHGAGIGQPLHEHGMGRRRFGRRERRTAPRGPAAHGGEFLDGHRHAVQRSERRALAPAFLGFSRAGQRAGAVQREGVDDRIGAFGVLQRAARHVHGRDLAQTVQFAQAWPRGLMQHDQSPGSELPQAAQAPR